MLGMREKVGGRRMLGMREKSEVEGHRYTTEGRWQNTSRTWAVGPEGRKTAEDRRLKNQ